MKYAHIPLFLLRALLMLQDVKNLIYSILKLVK